MKAAIMPEAGKIELVDVVLPEMQDAVGCSFLMVKIVKKLDSVRCDVWVCIVENKRVYVSYMPCFMFVLMYTVTEGRSC